jgi:hypothetical protein
MAHRIGAETGCPHNLHNMTNGEVDIVSQNKLKSCQIFSYQAGQCRRAPLHRFVLEALPYHWAFCGARLAVWFMYKYVIKVQLCRSSGGPLMYACQREG